MTINGSERSGLIPLRFVSVKKEKLANISKKPKDLDSQIRFKANISQILTSKVSKLRSNSQEITTVFGCLANRSTSTQGKKISNSVDAKELSQKKVLTF